MSATKITAMVLDCDQGMGTLVKIYEKDGGGVEQLTKLALIDLGSEVGIKRFAGSAIDDVIDALKAMPSPELSLLVVSHQDYDHWSLLPHLMKRIRKEFPDSPVFASRIVTGGELWLDRAARVVDACAPPDKKKNRTEPLTTSYTAYANPKASPKSFASIAGVEFKILAANAPCSRAAEDIVRNGTSAVIVIEFGGHRIVLPGDATADTCAFINDTLAKWGSVGLNPVGPCYMLTAPHHGALRTLASNFTCTKPKLTVAGDFATFMSADCVAASAGYESKFEHPSKEVMRILSVSVTARSAPHDYIVWDDENGNWEAVKKTKDNIYTTVCSLDTPPVHRSWTFTIKATGTVATALVVRSATDLRPIPFTLVARPAAERATAPRQAVLAARPQAAVSRTAAT